MALSLSPGIQDRKIVLAQLSVFHDDREAVKLVTGEGGSVNGLWISVICTYYKW